MESQEVEDRSFLKFLKGLTLWGKASGGSRVRTTLLVVSFAMGSYLLNWWNDRDVRSCAEENDQTLRIQACTRMIESGRFSRDDLPTALVNRGEAYTQAGQYDRAIQDTTEAIHQKPSLASAFAVRGAAYLGNKQFDRGIIDLNLALQRKPEYPYALIWRGIAYSENREYDHAIEDFDHVLRIRPLSFMAFVGRGSVYKRKGDYTHALQDDNRAIRLNAKVASVFVDRGDVYRKMGDYTRAMQDYDQAIKLDPQRPTTFYGVGLTQFARGDMQSAVSNFDKAVQLEPTEPYHAIWLYLAQSRAGLSASDDLARNALRLDQKQWPGPVISLYEGKISSDAVLEAALNPDSSKQLEQQCEAYFYVGEYFLLRGEKENAARMLRMTLDTKVFGFVEYDSAKAELIRLGL